MCWGLGKRTLTNLLSLTTRISSAERESFSSLNPRWDQGTLCHLKPQSSVEAVCWVTCLHLGCLKGPLLDFFVCVCPSIKSKTSQPQLIPHLAYTCRSRVRFSLHFTQLSSPLTLLWPLADRPISWVVRHLAMFVLLNTPNVSNNNSECSSPMLHEELE